MENNSIHSIPIEALVDNPLNANRMSEGAFKKLVRNIERTGRYEPVVVRRHPQRGEHFEIINGHHRVRVLRELGIAEADCVVWDVDDEQVLILLSTLNQLRGSDVAERKMVILRDLVRRFDAKELSKLLPDTKKHIEALVDMKRPVEPAKLGGDFARPVVFFVNEKQSMVLEEAIEKAGLQVEDGSRAARRAEAVTIIARGWLDRIKNSEARIRLR